jgi:hypothetical protein
MASLSCKELLVNEMQLKVLQVADLISGDQSIIVIGHCQRPDNVVGKVDAVICVSQPDDIPVDLIVEQENRRCERTRTHGLQ